MLCNISAARELGHEGADIPLHLYGPPGVARFLAAAMQLSDTYLLCPVLIHELVAGPVPGRDADHDVRLPLQQDAEPTTRSSVTARKLRSAEHDVGFWLRQAAEPSAKSFVMAREFVFSQRPNPKHTLPGVQISTECAASPACLFTARCRSSASLPGCLGLHDIC